MKIGTIVSRVLKVLAVAVLAVGVLAGAAAAYAAHALSRRWEVPAPAVRAATAPAAVARGAALFHSECAGCHAGTSGRASGKPMEDIPPFLGVFRSANITAHLTAGVGGLRDDQLARVIRNGVLPDGRRTMVMPTYPRMSDDDLAAVLGFLRSPDPALAPDPTVQPRPAPSLVGKLILTFVAGTEPERSAPAVAAPARGPTAAYGAYLADEVLHCYVCHTAGFGAHKLREPGAYAGGFELRDEGGHPLRTPNITPDPDTGVGRWTAPQLVRAIRDGIRPDGNAIRPPMGRFRELGDDELLAIALYLRSLPPVRHGIARPGGAADPPASARAAAPAAFARRGCGACHGPGAPYREKLRAAAAQPVEEVAEHILHPERFNGSTRMPTFAGSLGEDEVRALAEYARAEGASLASEQATAGGKVR